MYRTLGGVTETSQLPLLSKPDATHLSCLVLAVLLDPHTAADALPSPHPPELPVL